MKLKNSLLVVLTVTTSFGWSQPTSQPTTERPPRYPGPGNPRPEPRPPVRPEPRPEPRPPVRPEPRPEPRPPVRPEPRPEPRPPVRPEPRPEPRPPVRPEPRPEPRPPVRPEPRPEPRPPVRPEPRPEPRPPVRPEPRPEPRPPVRPEPRPPIRPEPRPPVRPNPRPHPRPPGPVRPHPRPYPPRPIRPLPPRPQPPIVRPDPGYYFSQVANLNSIVTNQRLDLMRLLNLYQFHSGYTLESVVVRTDGRDNSTLKLWVNNQVDDEVRWVTSHVSLYPRYDLRLGTELQNLFLEVQGSAYISQIEVRLRQVGYTGDYYQFRIPIELEQTLYDYETIELHQWINLQDYHGYRLIAIEVDADAYYAAEKISLLIDDQLDAETYMTGEGSQITLFPLASTVIGVNTNRLALQASGGGALNVNRVTLRLSRY